MYPVVTGAVCWETTRKGTPSKCTFSVLKNGNLDFREGDAVMLKYGEKNVFFGFVFTKSRNKDGVISVTAYDQLRYFKNKHSYYYEGWTTTKLLERIANDFGLQLGEVEDTIFPVSRVEDRTSLFDMVQSSLDETLLSTRKLYVMYDDYGKLCLKNINSMITNVAIVDSSAENFDYSSSIDSDTYNRVIVYYKQGEVSTPYMVKSEENIGRWGVLQYTDTVETAGLAAQKANALLNLYNSTTKTLSITNAIGDISVRAGSMVYVRLNLGDTLLDNYMFVERATHKFEGGIHTMNLTLVGGQFVQ